MVTRRAGSTASALLKLLTVLLTLALVAAACGGDDDEGGGDTAGEETGEDGATSATTSTTEARDEGEPVAGGSITVGLEAETNGWRPGTASWSESTYNIAYALMDPLMARSAEGTVEPFLAESLVPNEELTQYTLTLRPDVTFHDGTPLNAEAIKTIFDTYLKAPSSNVLGQLADVESFEVTGELTGVYNLSGPNSAFPDVLTLSAGMPFSPTAAEEQGDAYSDNPVGAGPYRFVSWARDDRLVIERYEDYWGEPAYLDEITFQPIPDEDTRFQSVLSGDIQAFTTLRQSIISQAFEAEEQGTIETNFYLGNNGGGAIFNTLQPPVDDVRVRRGLAHGVNQEDLVEVLGGTGFTPTQTQFFSQDSPWYSEAAAEAYPSYDAEEATSLLDEYINDPERSDGKSPGDPIAVDFNCPPDPSLIELAQTYQAFWGALGVEVQLNSVEQAAHIANALGSSEEDPPFSGQGYMINCWRSGAEGDPYPELSTEYGDPLTSSSNFTNYQTDTIREQLDLLKTSADPAERKAAVEAISLELSEQVPQIWSGATATVIGTVPELNNVGGWTLPDGTPGIGTPSAVTRWAQVWMEQ